MRKFVGALLAGALVMGACGGDSGDGGPDPADDPKAALIEAFEDLGEGEGRSITFSLSSDEESLQTMFEESDQEVPENTAEIVLDSSLTVAANSAETIEEVQVEILVEIGGEEAAAILMDGYELYAHADVRYLAETFGQDPALIDQQLATLPAGMEFVEQAVDNEWIHLTGLQGFAEQAGVQEQIPNLADEQTKLVEQLSTSLDENSEVTEGDEDGPGTHLEATVDAQAFAQDVEEISSELSGGAEMPSTEGAPEGDIIIDTWVEDGTLTQIKFDFIKNAEALGEGEDIPDGVEEFAILIELEEFDGEVDTPDDAVEVSIQEIMGAFMGAAMGGMEGTDGETDTATEAGDVCDTIADLPAEQQEAYKDICPDL